MDLTLTASLRFPRGILASIDCSFEQPFRCVYELVGTRGVIEVPDAYLPPAVGSPIARLRTLGLAFRLGRRYATSSRPWSLPRPTSMPRWSTPSLARLPPAACFDPAEDGLAQMKVLDAILASARS